MVGTLVVEGSGPHAPARLHRRPRHSRMMHLQFVESESTSLFYSDRAYWKRYGKPGGILFDKQVCSGQTEGCDRRERHDPNSAGFAYAEHDHHLRQNVLSKGRSRAPMEPAGTGWIEEKMRDPASIRWRPAMRSCRR